jgi:kynureninase
MEQRHKSLTNTLSQLIEERCGGWNLKLASPKSHSDRGGHVAFQFEHAEKLAQALVHQGVVVSSRKPDALRWGVHPLATTHEQIWRAVEILRTILESQIWQDARFNAPSI